MATDGIFLQSASGLTLLQQQPYDSEALLQKALAEHPEVLAGPTTTGEAEARLLLLRREMVVPSASAGASTFSLDHLFVDAEGVPVLVEVKRSSDTRIRREVVGQMLDYAANGVKYWPTSLLREALERTAAEAAQAPEDMIAELNQDIEAEEFWRSVESNLRAGRIRMIFVADSLPPELVRIIEFLNEQMTPAEVLGVELQQYIGGGSTVFVPSVVGRTMEAQAAKSTRPGGEIWTRDSFLAAAEERCTPEQVRLMQELFADVDHRGIRLNWGRGITPGVSGWYQIGGQPSGAWALYVGTGQPPRPYLVFHLGDLVKRIGAGRVERAASFLGQIPEMEEKIESARASDWRKYPSVRLDDLIGDADALRHVFSALNDLTAAD